MASFVWRLQNILVRSWPAILFITILVSSLSILPVNNVVAQDCNGNWGLWDFHIKGKEPGTEPVCMPGEVLNCSIHFELYNPSDCPNCRQQVFIGIDDSVGKPISVGSCLYDGIPAVCPNRTARDSNFAVTAPDKPGEYRIIIVNCYLESCAEAKNEFPHGIEKGPSTEITLITITVSASKTDGKSVAPTTPTLPTPTKEDSTTSSSGSGTTQDGGASKTGVSTQFIIIAIALLVLLFIFSLMGSEARRRFIRFILVLAVVSFLGYLFWQYGIPVISKWIRENLSTIIGVLLSLGALAIAGIAIWKNWDRIKEKLGTVDEIPGKQTEESDPEEADIEQLCNRIRTRIESMNVPRRHRIEDPYVREVYQWLASEFGYDNVKYEKHGESGRPDLIVDDIIAIEVKGPATNDSLNDLKHKTKYIAPNTKYKRLICVLFEHDYSDSKYDEITQALKILHRNKIFFIQKSSRRG